MRRFHSCWLLLLLAGFCQPQTYASSEASVQAQQSTVAALLQHYSDWTQPNESHEDSDAASCCSQAQQTTSPCRQRDQSATAELAVPRNTNPARAPPNTILS